MKLLVKRLGHVNVHPYYVYVHDLVKGVEDLRTTLQTALDIEKHVRGVDRRASTRRRSSSTRRAAAASATRTRYEHYDRETGISVFTAPSVKPGVLPVLRSDRHARRPRSRRAGSIPAEQDRMVEDALAAARARLR